jgi:hypothetical protein
LPTDIALLSKKALDCSHLLLKQELLGGARLQLLLYCLHLRGGVLLPARTLCGARFNPCVMWWSGLALHVVACADSIWDVASVHSRTWCSVKHS